VLKFLERGTPTGGEMRLTKYLARLGLCSRRQAEGWIKQGVVEVDSQRVTKPGRVLTEGAQVRVHGHRLVPTREERRTRVWLLHKPRGVLTARVDTLEKSRQTLTQLLQGRQFARLRLPPHVVPVGRLDYQSEGLLLLTNNGSLARALEHPTTGIPREYLVRMHSGGFLLPHDTPPAQWHQQASVQRLAAGICVDGVSYGCISIVPAQSNESIPRPIRARARHDGSHPRDGGASPTSAMPIGSLRKLDDDDAKRGPANRWYQVELKEGKHRALRRVFAHLGMPVSRVKRISYGPLKLGSLQRGDAIEARPRDVKRLLALGADVEEVMGTVLGNK